MFLGSWAGLGTVLGGGGVPDRSLDYRRMLWFRIRVVPWLAQALIDLACAPNLKFDSLIFSLVLLCLRSDSWCACRFANSHCSLVRNAGSHILVRYHSGTHYFV